MLYFHLNTTNFIDSIINGEENNLGVIETFFFNNVFSTLLDAKVYTGSWSEDPIFLDISVLKGKKWLLSSIDDESTEVRVDEILKLMEKAHLIKIPNIGKSLNDMGVHYEYIVHISNQEVNSNWINYMAENNLQDVEEAIGNRDMTLEEKILFLSSELLDIGSAGNQLTIVDPYLFPKKHDEDYIELFLGVIRAAKVSGVKVITDLKKYESNLALSIKQQMPVLMSVYNSNELHDRWWIVETEKKAFICGTSLNGVGKGKLSTITSLMKDDVEKIINGISVGRQVM